MQVHQEEILFLINSADPSLVEAYTNSADLCRQLEEHGAQRIPTPACGDDSLRDELARHLSAAYLLKARQVRFVKLDELKIALRQRRADRARKVKALSAAEREEKARKAAYAREWRAKQSPQKKQEIREQSQAAKKNESDYVRELRRQQERERYAKLTPAQREELRQRDRAYKAARRAQRLKDENG